MRRTSVDVEDDVHGELKKLPQDTWQHGVDASG
jgi:hypothetical protein